MYLISFYRVQVLVAHTVCALIIHQQESKSVKTTPNLSLSSFISYSYILFDSEDVDVPAEQEALHEAMQFGEKAYELAVATRKDHIHRKCLIIFH